MPTSVTTPAGPQVEANPGAPRPRYEVRDVAGAFIAALSVSVLALSAMGIVFGGLIGVGLIRMGLPEVVIWPVIGIGSVLALTVAGRLGLKVWRYEISLAADVPPPSY
ncbi:MAG: hypothetical protein WD075_15465 [Rhodospirillales bacterium]